MEVALNKFKETRYEFLKVVAMLMIVSHHLVTQNIFNIDIELKGLDPSRVFLQLMGNHAFIGNNLFFMISAWFLCKHSEHFSIKKTAKRIWNIEKIMLFYSIGIPLLFFLSNSSYSINEIFRLSMILPCSTGLWWYPTSYIVFLLFFPFLQQGLDRLKEKEIKKLAILML